MEINKEDVCRMVDSLRTEILEMLKDLVSFKSKLGVKNGEIEVQNYMAKVFENLGLKVDRFKVDIEKLKNEKGFSPVDWNCEHKETVVGTFIAKNKVGKSLIFNGHVDVVPEGPEDEWKGKGPWIGEERDGRFYGRGAGDMKAGVVAMCTVLKVLKNLGFIPTAQIHFQTVLEEECTGNGALSCVHQGYTADAAIIPEPFPFLQSAQLGVAWFRLKVRGKPAHVLNTSAGNSAIECLLSLYSGLRELEEQWNSIECRHPIYNSINHPINFNLGIINGGDWASSVAAECCAQVRIGFFPGISIEQVKIEIENKLKEISIKNGSIRYTIEWYGFQAEGCVFDTNSQLYESLRKVHLNALNRPIPTIPVTCTTDARFFALYQNIPVTCYGPESTSIHGIDESVSIESLLEVIKVLTLFVIDWCGVEKISN
eukprot:TRINITY_DN262_c2_g1_i1.p1 TRINITY_DN262_c2_g1~~TRINITY_DN262_c2_g1_i1.p1  ORF type:complete len:427 (-),score=221.65 TRINITY_DN262_c2_g1_i1:201-1481(-)